MRKSLIATLLITLSQFGFAQVSSNSPYSSYGLGELGGMDHANYIGIGNSTITQIDSTVINFYNPASYNSLAKGQPLFTFGISSRLSTYSENGSSTFNTNTGIQHFALAFPIKKHWGLAFGLKPYSRRGYSFSSGETVDTDSIVYQYSGEGGINEVFLGLSSDIIKFKNTRLSVGANLGYLFGETINTRKSGISSNNVMSGGVGVKLIDINSFHYEIGTYFSHRIKNHTITASAVFDPSQSFKGKFENGLYYSANVDVPQFYDTLSFNATRSNVTSAGTMSFGLNYKLLLPSNDKNGRKLNSEISVSGMFSVTDWSLFNDPFDTDSITYPNTNRLNFGIEYIPEVKAVENATITKFHHRMRYRAGYYQYTLPYEVNGDQVADQGVTFGLGFPIVIQKSLSSLNIGFSYGTRGTSDQNVLKEKYYGINLGITIAPGFSEKWFRKPKLN